MTIDELQAKAWTVMGMPSPKISAPNPDAALYRYWLMNKDVGPPMSNEYALDDGTVALITATGRILHWLGGDEVDVL